MCDRGFRGGPITAGCGEARTGGDRRAKGRQGGSERPASMKRDLPISHARWRQSQVPLAGDGAARAQKKDPRCLFQVRTGRARLEREVGMPMRDVKFGKSHNASSKISQNCFHS